MQKLYDLFNSFFPNDNKEDWIPFLLLNRPINGLYCPEVSFKIDEILRRCRLINIPEDWDKQIIQIHKEIEESKQRVALFHFMVDLLLNQKENYDARLLDKWPNPLFKGSQNPSLIFLALTLTVVPRIEKVHHQLNIDPQITKETLESVGTKCHDYFFFHKTVGIFKRTIHWFQFHCEGSLFKMGRFEYMIKTIPKGIFIYEKEGEFRLFVPDIEKKNLIEISHHSVEKKIRPLEEGWTLFAQGGEKAIDLHIPGGGAMDPQGVEDSFTRAKVFFRKLKPEYNLKTIICFSWIFSPDLPLILPETSNLVALQKKVYTYPIEEDDIGSTIFVFNTESKDLNQWPEKTSLQRAIKAHVKKGGKFRWGSMIYPFTSLGNQ